MVSIYFPFYSITYILYLFYSKFKNKSHSYILLILVVALLSWFPAFACSMSADYDTYSKMYDYIENSSLEFQLIGGRVEYGFLLTMKIFSKLGFSFTGYLFCLCCLGNTLILKYINTVSYPLLSFGAFLLGTFYAQEPNLVRQVLAVSICLFSIKYIYSNNLKFYLFNIFIASLFHQSALVMLPFYFLNKKNKVYIIFFIAWGISLLARIVDYHFNFGSLLNIISNYNEKYGSYGADEELGVDVNSVVVLFTNLLQILIVYVYLKYKLDTRVRVQFLLFTIGTILLNLMVSIPMLYRLSLYFVILLITVPSILIKLTIKTDYLFAMILMVLTVIYYVRLYIIYSLTPIDKGFGSYIIPLSEMFIN